MLFERSEQDLLATDGVEFRTRMRERCHHTVEIPTCESAYDGTPLPAEQTATVEKFSRVWDKRRLSHDLVEHRFATTILEIAKKVQVSGSGHFGQFGL